MQVLEWFSGIGGCAAALGPDDDVVLAVDHDEAAHAVYSSWWQHRAIRRNIAHYKARDVPAADLWWMSPPCQPYTVRGNHGDLDDRRSSAFLRIVDLLDTHAPEHIGLENVPGFATSQAHRRLRGWLDDAGYSTWEGELTPEDLGVPMIRRRFFLVASRTRSVQAPVLRPVHTSLSAYIDPAPTADTTIDASVLDRFADALHIVDANDPTAAAACFTGAYARSPVYAGSYLRQRDVLRLFAPSEILALLGFPDRCRLPPDLSRKKAYKLVGNSLSVHCVRAVLTCLRDAP